MDYSKVRGFNYQPSYGSTSFENWLNYNPSMIELELRRGKEYFPKFNVVRYWLSWEAYLRNPKQFIINFENSLQIAHKLNIKVIPCLLNRWHDADLDNGGIYIDHFLPNCSWSYRENKFDKYINEIISCYKGDERILLWDLCNEPFSYKLDEANELLISIEKAEYMWLERLYHLAKNIEQKIPVGISIHGGHGINGVKRIEPITDVLLVHPYYIPQHFSKEEYEALVAEYKKFSLECNKSILATETCWGHFDDNKRAELIKYTLDVLTSHNIGFVVHALHYSQVIDLHDLEDGPVGWSENLSFINKDGSLRVAHDIFNKY